MKRSQDAREVRGNTQVDKTIICRPLLLCIRPKQRHTPKPDAAGVEDKNGWHLVDVSCHRSLGYLGCDCCAAVGLGWQHAPWAKAMSAKAEVRRSRADLRLTGPVAGAFDADDQFHLARSSTAVGVAQPRDDVADRRVAVSIYISAIIHSLPNAIGMPKLPKTLVRRDRGSLARAVATGSEAVRHAGGDQRPLAAEQFSVAKGRPCC